MPVPVNIPLQGVGPVSWVAAAAAATGNEFDNDGEVQLFVRNDAVVARTLTIKAKGDCNFEHGLIDVVRTIPASSNYIEAFKRPSQFNNARGRVEVFLDVETSVFFAPVAMPSKKGQ